ncbi:MAG: YdcF family protein [Alphaproteobacteria bacterium]
MSFFHISKIVWFVAQPSNFLALMFLFGLLLYWRWSTRRGIQIILLSVAIYMIGGFLPVGNALLVPLEEHFTRDKSALPPDGIIVLGGVVDTITATKRDDPSLTERAERLTEAVALARRFPNAKIVFTGGDGALDHKTVSEREVVEKFFKDMGVDMSRVIFEDESRTTRENARYTSKIITQKPGERWLLVTSAFHMWRSHRCFRSAGLKTIPWPVDYSTRGPEDLKRFPPRVSEGWRRIDLAVREWIGLAVYGTIGGC